ncbi:twin-arginine translocation signal domain-containing protein [Limobrevibacterium gyesilva]|uniref:Twin-arginine translocation signal domain-containing protein n=1 Tax=Limobrevibacterium gyesilva TaxID=2991712 RepID=A0AA41YIG7_9PROT|nr:twin-arginine translocation signal domain-containing protein [Limobrevibacterium gyesilva]MCW3474156.1 twin-arginine translocation signal domain-containing protein [Limobrevibacterium gyesilva]
MDKSTDTRIPSRRRRFLAALGIGGVAAAVAAAARPAQAMTPPGSKGGTHYRESEHVKQYYRVNRY